MSRDYENDAGMDSGMDTGMEKKDQEGTAGFSGQETGDDVSRQDTGVVTGQGASQDNTENNVYGNAANGSASIGNAPYGSDSYGSDSYGIPSDNPNASYGTPGNDPNASYGTPGSDPNAYGGAFGYQSGQTYGQPYPGYYTAGGQKKKDGIAFGVASLVLGIVTIVFFCSCISWITGILAIVFGIVQLVKYSKKGLAIGGIITGAVGLVLTLILYVTIFFNYGSVYRYNDIYDHIYDDIYDEFYDGLYDQFRDGI